MVRVALDVMGSDDGPDATVAGAAAVSLGEASPEILLVGHEEAIRDALARHPHRAERLRVHAASQVVTSADTPASALAERPDASVLVAARLVAGGEADVLVSAGNTGAVTLACARSFARLEGVARAGLGAVVPTARRHGDRRDPFTLLLDAGLTLEPTADDLVAFAIMGAAYARVVSKNPRPTVALLSNGAEATKGTTAIVEAHARLRARASARPDDLEFLGNIEGMDLVQGAADVVVTGGFTGNIALKMLEGVNETLSRVVAGVAERRWRYAAGLWLLGPAVRRLRDATDWQQYGGVPILGFDRLCIKAHGRSTPRAIANALKVATRTAREGLVDGIRSALGARS